MKNHLQNHLEILKLSFNLYKPKNFHKLTVTFLLLLEINRSLIFSDHWCQVNVNKSVLSLRATHIRYIFKSLRNSSSYRLKKSYGKWFSFFRCLFGTQSQLFFQACLSLSTILEQSISTSKPISPQKCLLVSWSEPCDSPNRISQQAPTPRSRFLGRRWPSYNISWSFLWKFIDLLPFSVSWWY